MTNIKYSNILSDISKITKEEGDKFSLYDISCADKEEIIGLLKALIIFLKKNEDLFVKALDFITPNNQFKKNRFKEYDILGDYSDSLHMSEEERDYGDEIDENGENKNKITVFDLLVVLHKQIRKSS